MAKYKHYKLSNEIEVWKDVKNYEGYYIVSSMGKVKSLDRIVLGKNGASYFRSGKLKSSVTNKWGYLQVLLSKNNKQRIKNNITIFKTKFSAKKFLILIAIELFFIKSK